MKTCPNCGELVGDTVDSCFKCRYNFRMGKVLSSNELKRDPEIVRVAEQLQKETILKNPVYEYKTVIVEDLANGKINIEAINSILTRYSNERWRLHSVLASEIGKNATGINVGGIGVGVNATADEILLIFERIISPGNI